VTVHLKQMLLNLDDFNSFLHYPSRLAYVSSPVQFMSYIEFTTGILMSVC